MNAYHITVILTILCIDLAYSSCGPECIDPDTKRTYPSGMTWRAKNACIERGCEMGDNGEASLLPERTCPVIKLQEGCTLTKGDMTQEYPECCPEQECPT